MRQLRYDQRLFVGALACDDTHTSPLISWSARLTTPVALALASTARRLAEEGWTMPSNDQPFAPRSDLIHDGRFGDDDDPAQELAHNP